MVNASHYKIYHSSLAYTFLLELLDTLDLTQFEEVLWPQMRKELKRPWEKQNLNTIHFLIKSRTKYPTHVDEDFLNSSIRSADLLTPVAFKHLSRVYWTASSNVIASTHSSFDAFAQFLSRNVAEKVLKQFWRDEINKILLAPTTLKEIATLRILTVILNDLHVSADTVKELLSNSFISMLAKNLRSNKLVEHKDDHYHHFFQAIEKFLGEKSNITEDEKVAIILRFIDHPGTLLIERYAPNRFIHRVIGLLKADGVKGLFAFYKSILLDQRKKDPKSAEKWLKAEKEYCIQMLQTLLANKSGQSAQEWRSGELTFLFGNALFNINKHTDDLVATGQTTDVLPTDLAAKMKQTAFASLLVHSQKLDAEKATLLDVVKYCNEKISTNAGGKALRHSLSDDAIEAWNKMYSIVANEKKRNKILYSVFDILLMHMGLQLFVDAPMAVVAIDDLEKCMERSQKKIKSRASTAQLGEAEWIEVVVDLFLQLLSQNKNFLRTIVDNTFPKLCPHLTASAIDQILTMLDMNELNPLTPNASAVVESDDESEVEDENDDEADEPSDMECDEDGSDDDESLTEDDEGTVTDQLRSVISQALIDMGQETDTESVDLNDMDDAEASRLDDVLSTAFQNMVKKTSGGKKKTKQERTVNTTVMHFRIRVLDLLEIYLKTSPSLDTTLNILTDLLPMYEHCAGNKDLVPLTNRLSRVLRTLFGIRAFSSTNDVTEAKLFELLHYTINIKANPAIIGEQNKLKMNLLTYLISVSQLLKSPDGILLEGIAACLKQFLDSRNPKLQQQCFSHILQMRWIGAWQLGQIIAHTSFLEADKCRSFKRIQSLELLTEIYKCVAFIEQRFDDLKLFKEKIENAIVAYVQWLLEAKQVSSKEFVALLQLLIKIHKSSKEAKKPKSTLKWTKISEIVKSIRQRVPLDSVKAYVAFCKHFGIEDDVTNQYSLNKQLKENRQISDTQNGDDEETTTAAEPATNGAPRKRKVSQSNGTLDSKRTAKQLKKAKKEERLKLSSVGLNDVPFSFTELGVNQDMD